jgi:DNA-binding NtrC family response regulator
MNLVHRYRPEVPVIVISGHEVRSASKYAPNFLHMATKLGAVSSIQKPFRPGDFLSVVDSCLSAVGHLPPPSAPARKNLSTD